jgi:hypothetical protein
MLKREVDKASDASHGGLMNMMFDASGVQLGGLLFDS